MELGFDSFKDFLDVLLVPLALGALAVGWPALVQHRKRLNFESLIRRELAEAEPHGPSSENIPWHSHLSKRFLHEGIISSMGQNPDFVLSLKPELSYHVSQLWIEFGKAQKESESGKHATPDHARQFSWHLEQVCLFLDHQRPVDYLRLNQRKSKLRERVWVPWDALIQSEFPRENV